MRWAVCWVLYGWVAGGWVVGGFGVNDRFSVEEYRSLMIVNLNISVSIFFNHMGK